MRQIVFRGQAFGTREWVYGNLRHRDDGGNFIETTDGNHCFPVLEDTIGQYTGLKDKNGKMIFENDVVDLFARPAIVKYEGWKFVFERIHNSGITMQYGFENYGECEVIGNIHDNNFKP